MGTFLTLEDRVVSLQKNTACEKVMLLNLFNDYVDLLFLITLFFLNIMFPVNVIMYNTYYIKIVYTIKESFVLSLILKLKSINPFSYKYFIHTYMTSLISVYEYLIFA